jgi:hypothetical protein
LALPIPAGQALPNVPPAGLSAANISNDLPGSKVIAARVAVSRSDPSTYVFTRVELRANLFLIPLH